VVPSRCNTIDEESGLTDGGESDVLLGDSARIEKKILCQINQMNYILKLRNIIRT